MAATSKVPSAKRLDIIEGQNDALKALLVACKEDDSEKIKALIKDEGLEILTDRSATIDGGTALHYSVRLGKLDALDQLLLSSESGAVEIKDELGNTALHAAALGGHAKALEALLKRESIQKLINERNKAGETALLQAARGRQPEACDVLLGVENVELDLLLLRVWTSYCKR